MAGSGKGPLRIAIEDFLETFNLPKIVLAWLSGILEPLEKEAIDFYANIVKSLGVEEVLPKPLKPAVLQKSWGRQPIQLGPILMMGGGILIGFLAGAIQPAVRQASYKSDRFFMSGRPDASTAWQMARRTPEMANELNDAMLDQGFTPAMITAWRHVTEPVLNAVELETLRRKGGITTEEFRSELGKMGWTDERIQQIMDLRDLIPGAGDLIRMAVREAFTPDIVERFGYAQDYPAEFGQWMEKQGFSDEWAKKYWYAHWELPPINQGYEMLQRLRPGETSNPVTRDDIETLLKIQDIAPFWRDRLLEISYNPLTRVDVRRMFGMGVLTEDEVFKNYLDLGYNEENAKRMTEFTVRFERQAERGLTREAIQGSYSRGLTSRSEAISQMAEVGYPEDIADFYLDMIDFDLAARQSDEKIAAIKTKYLSGMLDNSTVIDEIGQLNLPAERMQSLLEVWQVQLDNKVKIASRSELDDFYRRDLIEETEYQSHLKTDGYSPEMIDLFTRRIDNIMLEEAQIEAMRAQREEERLRTARLATTYQKVKAGLNVTIAQARLAIADLKVAKHDLVDPAAVVDNKVRQDEIKVIIAEVQLEKAEQTYEYKTERIKGEL